MKITKREYAIFIPSYWRADNVKTVDSLRKCWYTGEIYIVCSDDDASLEEYKKNFWSNVRVFNKEEYWEKTDTVDSFKSMKTVLYARNAIWDIAKQCWYEYFWVFDDDYTAFNFRRPQWWKLKAKNITNMDYILDCMLEYYKKTPFKSIAMWQAGDFIWWVWNALVKWPKRKVMNSFLLSQERRFWYKWTMNDDVTTYTYYWIKWDLFLTVQKVSLIQWLTQQNAWWLTDIYLDKWTYVKSFYTVIVAPSCCKVCMMWNVNKRIHHKMLYTFAFPMILSEKRKK